MKAGRLKIILAGALSAILMSGIPVSALAAGFEVKGKVVEEGSSAPVPGAALKIDDGVLWAMSDADGAYLFSNLSKGHYLLTVECLGYVSQSVEIELGDKDLTLDFTLKVSSLAIDEVTVTAERAKTGLNTTTTLGRDHPFRMFQPCFREARPSIRTLPQQPAFPCVRAAAQQAMPLSPLP